jgi:hypothetical protein
MDQTTIAEKTRFVATSHAVSTDLEGEAVILDTSAGEYYGLNEVGARIWTLLQEPMAFAELVDALVEEYAVDREQCEAEVRGLLGQMVEKNLLEIQSGESGRSE